MKRTGGDPASHQDFPSDDTFRDSSADDQRCKDLDKMSLSELWEYVQFEAEKFKFEKS